MACGDLGKSNEPYFPDTFAVIVGSSLASSVGQKGSLLVQYVQGLTIDARYRVSYYVGRLGGSGTSNMGLWIDGAYIADELSSGNIPERGFTLHASNFVARRKYARIEFCNLQSDPSILFLLDGVAVTLSPGASSGTINVLSEAAPREASILRVASETGSEKTFAANFEVGWHTLYDYGAAIWQEAAHLHLPEADLLEHELESEEPEGHERDQEL
jgi:hypothetical protein